jgi:hypothetical protein
VDTGANTFELSGVDATGYTAYTGSGTVAEVYQITGPYPQADLFDSDNLRKFQTAQSADVLYMVNSAYIPQIITRSSDTSWALNDFEFTDGPYLDTNTTTTTLTLGGTTGSVTVTASAVTGINNDTGFQTTDIGRLIRWRDPANNWTWLEITARSSTTVVTATIKGADASATTATVSWRLGVYSDTTGWPRTIGFHQNRLVLAGCDSFPDRYDLSKSNGYSSTGGLFAPSDPDGTVPDDSAIYGNLQSGSVNAIEWVASDNKGLLIGTSSQEWVVKASELNEVLTPANAKSDRFSQTGSAYIEAVQADIGSIFVQRARRRLFDIIYSFEQDTQKPRDISLTAEHITRNQVIRMAYQQEPTNTVWSLRNDGVLLGMTYYPDQGVFGWHRHIIGGSFSSGNAVVEDISVIPSPSGDRDELWMIVKRTINGGTKRYVEYMTRYYEDDIAKEDAFHVDSGLTYSGAATATVTGLDHLEGETVKVMIDGKSHPNLTVSGGAITLANSRTASKIQVGFGSTWVLRTHRLEISTTSAPTQQGKTKRVTGFRVRLNNTLGLKYGTGTTNLEEYDFNQGSEYDESLALFTGDTEHLLWPDGYETDAKLYFTDDGVFPCAILAIMPVFSVYDR